MFEILNEGNHNSMTTNCRRKNDEYSTKQINYTRHIGDSSFLKLSIIFSIKTTHRQIEFAIPRLHSIESIANIRRSRGGEQARFKGRRSQEETKEGDFVA